MANNNLRVSSLVLNEVQEVQEAIKSKQIPLFWNVFQFLYRFTMYYRDLGYNKTEIVGMAVEWLIDAKIDYEIDAVVELIESVPSQNDKKYRVLRELSTNITIYKEEIKVIKSVESRQAQRMYFSMLMVCKVQENKGSKNPNYIYADLGDVCRLGQMDACKLNGALIELGFKHKVIKSPLDGNYVTIEKMGGKKIAHEIQNFNPLKIKDYFIELFGAYEPETKPVIALDYWGDEEPKRYDSVSDCARDLGVTPSDISRCTQRLWQKKGSLSAKDYMFIDASKREDESDKGYNVRMVARKMMLYKVQRYYTKLKSGKLKLGEPIVKHCDTLEEFVETLKNKH